MLGRLTKEQIDDLLVYCGSEPRLWKDDETLICCPVHGESNPSMGISEEKQVCHCFACGFAGDFAKLLVYSKPEEFGLDRSTSEQEKRTEYRAYRRAREFLENRYELEVHEVGHRLKSVRRYEENSNIYLKEDRPRVEFPKFKLAPYMCGKETYAYFFQRGFTKDDMKKFMIGRDTDSKTVTIPVFFEDGKLAGMIGRYIAKNRKKNQRYKIYWDFERSSVLYPLDKVKVIKDTVILVEGQFDAIRMYRAGHVNTLAMMTNNLSEKQAEWLCKHCSCAIWIGDNDSRGIEAREKAREKLKDNIDFKTVDFPDHGKDVCDWSDKEIQDMLDNAHGVLSKRIRRL